MYATVICDFKTNVFIKNFYILSNKICLKKKETNLFFCRGRDLKIFRFRNVKVSRNFSTLKHYLFHFSWFVKNIIFFWFDFNHCGIKCCTGFATRPNDCQTARIVEMLCFHWPISFIIIRDGLGVFFLPGKFC